MQYEDSTVNADAVDPFDHDDYAEAALLDLLVREHPNALTSGEIRRHFKPHEDDSFYTKDIFERAAWNLASYGLTRHQGDTVAASRTAVRSAYLLDVLT